MTSAKSPDVVSTSDGLQLHLRSWEAPDPSISVALVHGYAEHVERYEHVGKEFSRRGISLYGVDLRGHGASPGTRGYVDRFELYHLDVAALVAHVRSRTDGPVGIFAHSMGGLVALDWMTSSVVEGVSGLALSSPLLGFRDPPSFVLRWLIRAASRVCPHKTRSTGLAGADVTRDEQKARAYEADERVFDWTTYRWIAEAMRAMDRVQAAASRIEIPTLLLYAGSDEVVSADATDRFARRLGSHPVEVERLAGHAHELVNEPPEERAVVIERVANWLLSLVGG